MKNKKQIKAMIKQSMEYRNKVIANPTSLSKNFRTLEIQEVNAHIGALQWVLSDR